MQKPTASSSLKAGDVGMPITEFKATGKPILAADLPYAHETIGEYGQVVSLGSAATRNWPQ